MTPNVIFNAQTFSHLALQRTKGIHGKKTGKDWEQDGGLTDGVREWTSPTETPSLTLFTFPGVKEACRVSLQSLVVE